MHGVDAPREILKGDRRGGPGEDDDPAPRRDDDAAAIGRDGQRRHWLGACSGGELRDDKRLQDRGVAGRRQRPGGHPGGEGRLLGCGRLWLIERRHVIVAGGLEAREEQRRRGIASREGRARRAPLGELREGFHGELAGCVTLVVAAGAARAEDRGDVTLKRRRGRGGSGRDARDEGREKRESEDHGRVLTQETAGRHRITIKAPAAGCGG